MKTFVVGGAVRDELLGVPVQDRDHVVVGATPEAMVSLGYRPIYLTVDSLDWTREATAESVYARVMERTTNGAIVVLHFDSPTTVNSLRLLDRINEFDVSSTPVAVSGDTYVVRLRLHRSESSVLEPYAIDLVQQGIATFSRVPTCRSSAIRSRPQPTSTSISARRPRAAARDSAGVAADATEKSP